MESSIAPKSMSTPALDEDEVPIPGQPRVSPAEPQASDPEATGAAAAEAFARDHDGLTEENERDALDYLLAPKPPRMYGVKVEYETEDGTRSLTFVIRGVNGRKIDDLEQANVKDTPDGARRMDQISADLALVAEGCLKLVTPKQEVELRSESFRTIIRPGHDPLLLASPAEALEARFGTQLGLVSGVAREIRRVSGYDPSKVGAAQRRLMDAAGNS